MFSGEAISRVRAKEYEYAEDRRLSAVIAVQEIIATGFLSNDFVMQQGLANRLIYDKPASKMGSRMLSRTDLQPNEDYQSLAAHLGKLAAHPWTIDDDTGGVSIQSLFSMSEPFLNHDSKDSAKMAALETIGRLLDLSPELLFLRAKEAEAKETLKSVERALRNHAQAS